MKILTLIDAYLPAYRHGGPVRTLASMVERLPRDYKFWILTGDRDLGDAEPFQGMPLDRWIDRDPARVFYMTPRSARFSSMVRLIRDAGADVVYANSLFSRLTIRYLLARRLRLVPNQPFVLAPRGELSPGALCRKSFKKKPFVELALRTGLLDGAVWQASTEMERDHIARALRGRGEIRVGRNICATRSVSGAEGVLRKRSGAARLVFISRIVPNKNVRAAIEALRSVRGDVTFDVYGPIEDTSYWQTCLDAARGLPPNVAVRHRGVLPHHQVAATFASHDFFVFPTATENFGHVIIESLAAGCPVVLSDGTPWRDLEARHAGFDIPLGDTNGWATCLQRCVDMDTAEHLEFRKGAAEAAIAFTDTERAVQQNVELFEFALSTKPLGRGLRARAAPP